jgi:hypothetical protein
MVNWRGIWQPDIYHDSEERLLFAGTGRHAGLEIVGALDELLRQVARRPVTKDE